MGSIKIGGGGWGGGNIFKAFILQVDTVKKFFPFANLLRFAAIFFSYLLCKFKFKFKFKYIFKNSS